jgi:hypothetical protein
MPRPASPFANAFRPQFSEHWQRCKQLPPLRPGEAEALTAAFLANRGVTTCPARYAEAVEHLDVFGYKAGRPSRA